MPKGVYENVPALVSGPKIGEGLLAFVQYAAYE